MKKKYLILAVSFCASFLISCAPEADGESSFANLNNNPYVNCQYGNSCEQAISLSAGQWREGSITSSAREAWYSFYAIAGTTYYISWDDSHSGPRSYNLDIRVSVYDSYGNQLFERDDTDEGEPLTIYSSGTVYIKVVALSEGNFGSFGIGYSTYSTPPPDQTYVNCQYGNSCHGTTRHECLNYYGGWEVSSCQSNGSMSQAISLTSGQWREGNINVPGGEAWYSFYATAGTTYYISWDDSYSGPRSYNLDVEVSAYNSYGDQLFSDDDTDEGEPLTIYSSGTIYIKVVARGSNTGSFGIRYSTYSQPPPPVETYVNCQYGNSCHVTTRNECSNYYGGWEVSSCQSNGSMNQAISLTAGQWMEGNINMSYGEAWYSFYATAGTTYYIWWNDSHSGPTSYNLDVRVSAYNSYGEMLFDRDDISEYDLEPITLYSSGTVYIKVVALSESNTGAFGIVYSLNNYMPW
jgi:hypothetical protein